MRNPNTNCEICNKPLYRRPYELKKYNHVCCNNCKGKLYSNKPEIFEDNLKKGQGWNKGMSKANGDVLSYGKPRSEKTKQLISKKLEGRKFSETHRNNISKSRMKLFDKIGRVGKEERGWRFARWKKLIFKRDRYVCKNCGAEDITAHHILSWKDYPELRFDIDNGITFCKECHKDLHRGRTRNNVVILN